MYEILTNLHQLKKLKTELAEAFPDPNTVPTYAQVERLPYLGAVIQECLRVHPGVVSRLPRVSPEVPVVYKNKKDGKNYVIPAGTPMSMTTLIMHMNSDAFANPREFRPERWIENPRLDRYLIAFARGTRNCIG